MSTSRLPYPSLFVLVVAALGCSSSSSGDPAPADTGGTKTDTRAGGSDALDEDTAVEDCSEPVEDRPPLSACVKHVVGSAVDPAGKPLADLVVSVCGGVCYFRKTKAHGKFDTPVGKFINHKVFSVLIHGRPLHASLYDAMPAPTGDGLITIPTPIVVPLYDAVGPDLPADGAAAGSATAGPITISWPDATDFDLDVEDVADKETGRKLKSAKWADLTKPPTFAVGQNLVQLYGLGPFDMKTCAKRPCETASFTKMAVTVKNEATPPLAAGTVVEFVVLETDLFSVPFTAGKPKVAATGKVSADGKTISTDAGQGVTVLTWVGVRPKK